MNFFAAVIGQMNIDFIFHEVESLPLPGEEVFAQNFKISLGGGPMVIPYHLSKLGVPARFGTFVGDDFESKIARELMDDLGYEGVEYLPHPADRPIVVTSVQSTSTERSFICYNQDANESSLDIDVLMDFFAGCKVAYFPKNIAVAKKLADDGVKLIMDVSWKPELTLNDLKPSLEYVTYFTPNDKEVKHLCNEQDLLKCLDQLAELVPFPVIKLGRNGVLTKVANTYYRIPALSGVNPIDPTGAGDNFLVGLIYGISLDLDFVESLKLGNVLGGLAAEVLGCYRIDLTQEMVLSRLNDLPDVQIVETNEQLEVLLNAN